MRLSMTGTETWTCLTLALAKLSPGCCSACHMSIDSSTGLACSKGEWSGNGAGVVLKSVCAAKAATLLHPKRQIACSVKLCVKCKIARLPAEIETAAAPPPPSLYHLCIVLRVCGAVQLRVSASLPLSLSFSNCAYS